MAKQRDRVTSSQTTKAIYNSNATAVVTRPSGRDAFIRDLKKVSKPKPKGK